jgi:hypothetical protein
MVNQTSKGIAVLGKVKLNTAIMISWMLEQSKINTYGNGINRAQ